MNMLSRLVVGLLAVTPLVSARAQAHEIARTAQANLSDTTVGGHWVWFWNGYQWVLVCVPWTPL